MNIQQQNHAHSESNPSDRCGAATPIHIVAINSLYDMFIDMHSF